MFCDNFMPRLSGPNACGGITPSCDWRRHGIGSYKLRSILVALRILYAWHE